MATPMVDDTSAEYVRVKLAFLERQKRTLHMTLDEFIAQVASVTKSWLDLKEKTLNSFQEMSSTLESTIIFIAHQVWEVTPDPEMIKNILAKVTEAAGHDTTALVPAVQQQVATSQGQTLTAHTSSVREPGMVSELESLFKYEAGHYPYLKRLMVDAVEKNRESGKLEPFHEVVDKVLCELYANKDEPNSAKEKRRGADIHRDTNGQKRPAKEQTQVCNHEILLESFKIQQSELETQVSMLLKNQSILESQLAQVLVLDNKFTERLARQDDKLQQFTESFSSHRPIDEDLPKKLSICFKELDSIKKISSNGQEIQKRQIGVLETKLNMMHETQVKEVEQLKSLSEKIAAGEKQIATLLGDFSFFEKKQLGRQSEFDSMIKSLISKHAKVEKNIEAILPIQTKIETEMAKLEGTKKEMERLGKKQQEVIKKIDSLSKSDVDNQKILRESSNELAICKSQIDSLLGKGAPGNVLDIADKVSRQQRLLQQQEQNTAATLNRLAEQYSRVEESLCELSTRVGSLKKTTDTVAQTNLSGFNKFSLRLAETEQMIRTVKSVFERKVQKFEHTQSNLCETVSDHHLRMEAFASTLDSQSVVNRDFKSCIQGILEKCEKLELSLHALFEESNLKSNLMDSVKEVINLQGGRLKSIESLICRYKDKLEALPKPATEEQDKFASAVTDPEHCIKSMSDSVETTEGVSKQADGKKGVDAPGDNADDSVQSGVDDTEVLSEHHAVEEIGNDKTAPEKGDSEKLDAKESDRQPNAKDTE